MGDADLAAAALRRGWRSISTDAGNNVRTTLRTAGDIFVRLGRKWQLVEWNETPLKGS